MQSYVDSSYYFDVYKGNSLTKENAEKYLAKATRDVDTLTFNRIVARGLSNLTPRQQEVIKDVICEYASFLYENEDMINTYLSSYGINGVNMAFGSNWNLICEQGVAMPKSLYKYLASTGLTSRSFLHYA